MQSYRQHSDLWPAARETIERYGRSVLELARTFAPGYQADVARNPDLCMTDPRVPTLAVAVNAYGRRGMTGWVIAQMEDLNRTAGGRDKMTAEEMQAAAEAIVTTYPQLRLTDVMLFFSRFKAGCYGRFYGKTDSLVITTALAQYVEWRTREMQRIEAARRHVANLMSDLDCYGKTDMTIDELRLSPLWGSLTPAQQDVLARLASERDHPGCTWVRYKFSIVRFWQTAADGRKTPAWGLNPAVHAQDAQLLHFAERARKTAPTDANSGIAGEEADGESP